jgi:hypothetical protein
MKKRGKYKSNSTSQRNAGKKIAQIEVTSIGCLAGKQDVVQIQ